MSDLWFEHRDDGHRNERQRVVAIEYQDDRPCNVLTELHWDHSAKPWFNQLKDKPQGTCPRHWDFDYCRRDDTLYYHNSGGGGELKFYVGAFVHPKPPKAKLWVADGVKIVQQLSKGERTVSDRGLLRLGYLRIASPLELVSRVGSYRTTNPFLVGEESGDSLAWCDDCKDNLPTDNLCEHMTWDGNDYVNIPKMLREGPAWKRKFLAKFGGYFCSEGRAILCGFDSLEQAWDECDDEFDLADFLTRWLKMTLPEHGYGISNDDLKKLVSFDEVRKVLRKLGIREKATVAS